jgi:multisubunit Na+/H+ antiporter MnhB subunit
MTSEPLRRVRITHPRTEAARRVPARPVSREIGEQTQVGEVYMSSLIRSQRRLAVIVCGLIATVLVGIALLGALAPGLTGLRLFGLPVPWLVLAVGVYPLLIALALYTVRKAERNERDFIELVRRPNQPGDPTR